MCRTARTIFSPALFFSRPDVLIARYPFSVEIFTVTGPVSPASTTRTKVQSVLSNSNGSSAHQPWLSTVRRKLKPGGVGIVISMGFQQIGRIAKVLRKHSQPEMRIRIG